MKDKLLLEIPESFETQNLIIRKYEKGDGSDKLSLFDRNDNRNLLKEHVKEATKIHSVDDGELNVRKHAAEWESRERFVMGIWEKESSSYLGELWIEPEKWEVPSFELGYFLGVGYQGRGLATEASLGALKFLFNDLNAHRITIITRDTNEKSWKVAERLGFQREGHIRECSFKDGKRWGLYRYGMLKSEFKSKENGQ
jgi:RimJ/RimL family protein N-acetyltransferase